MLAITGACVPARQTAKNAMSTADVRIEQEELEAIKRSVLIKSRRFLVDSIDPANHVSYLRSKFVFSERDAEEIAAPPSRSAKAEVFLDKLSRKGSQAYDEFQNSLCRDKTQLFLLTHMTKTLELLKHRVRDFKGIAAFRKFATTQLMWCTCMLVYKAFTAALQPLFRVCWVCRSL